MRNALIPLIQYKMKMETLSYKPTAIIVGPTGAGKTTLANIMCGTRHAAGSGRSSKTNNLFRNNVSVGMNSFFLIDTPGTDSSSETYKHAFLLRKALTTIAINTIFVIIKYDNRFEKMVANFYSQPVHLFKNKIVVMISHLDLSKNSRADFVEICKLFKEECPDVLNIIFYSEESLAGETSVFMFSCISNMDAEKLEISDEDFQLKFNTFEAATEIRRSFNEYRIEVQKKKKAYYDYIFSNELEVHGDDKDEVLHAVLVNFKNELDAMYNDFIEKHGGNMTEMNYFTFSIRMQVENVNLCDDFTNAVVPLMSYKLFDNQDPRNLIKRCPNPNCNLIWYKTEGCDGLTSCGNRDFESLDPSTIFICLKYLVTFIEWKLHVTKNVVEKKKSPPTTQATELTAVGCNASFVWAYLPKLDNDLILTSYKAKSMDEAKRIIKAERFNEVRENFERSINSDFLE